MLIFGVCAAQAADDERTPAEFMSDQALESLDTALAALNMLEEELGYQKGFSPDWETHPLVDTFNADPLGGLSELNAVLDAATDGKYGWRPMYPLRLAAGFPTGQSAFRKLSEEINAAEQPEAPAFESIPLEMRNALAPLYRAVEISRSARARALADLTREEQIALLAVAPLLWLNDTETVLDGKSRDVLTLLPREGGIDDESLARALISFLSQHGPSPFNDQGKFQTDTVLQSIRDYPENAAERLLQICGKIDREMLLRSANALWLGTYETTRRLDTLGDDTWSAVHPMRLTDRGELGLWGDILVLDENFAGYKLVIGGRGDNAYRDQHNTLLIDLGGDDRYVGRCGGAIGGLALLADLGGDDLYQGHARWITQGSAMLGVSLLWDRDGEDVYLADNFAQASAIAGAALLLDNSQASDDYHAGMLSQAFAMGGWACLHDAWGDNSLAAEGYSQGVGSYLGSALLKGSLNNNSYRIAGSAPGQGVGASLPQTITPGGFGLLLDPRGDDSYDAPAGQGAGFGRGIGALIDLGGDDTFIARRHAQGWASGSGAGVLIDYLGADRHLLKETGGLGAGEDFGCGVFVDKLGDDQYSAQGGICGAGFLGGFGLFVDEAGDDLYAPYESAYAIGAGMISPQHDSLGLFIDLAGKDVYSEAAHANGSLWTSGKHGCGSDRPVSTKEDAQ